jgi:hypothetical protein
VVNVLANVFSGVNLIAVKAQDSFGIGEALALRLTAQGANLTPVPSPAAVLLFPIGIGILGIAGARSRRGMRDLA